VVLATLPEVIRLRGMRELAVAAVLVLATGRVAAQGTTATPKALQPGADVESDDHRAWSYSASLFGYFVPDDQDYAQPTFAADHDRLHLEARYNYEALNTGSAWLGYAFSGGKKLHVDLTPMLGGVFGDLHGLAPGYELTLSWSRLELDSEGEYFFDFEDDTEDFFYNWSELYMTPAAGWRAGLAVQRTRAYQTSLDLQRGFLAGASFESVDLTAYVFNLGWENPTVVIAVEVGF
jgi:hypothetical protein